MAPSRLLNLLSADQRPQPRWLPKRLANGSASQMFKIVQVFLSGERLLVGPQVMQIDDAYFDSVQDGPSAARVTLGENNTGNACQEADPQRRHADTQDGVFRQEESGRRRRLREAEAFRTRGPCRQRSPRSRRSRTSRSPVARG